MRLKPEVQARFDEVESGSVKPIEGEEAYRRSMEKTNAQRNRG
jgi:hypothetical protein